MYFRLRYRSGADYSIEIIETLSSVNFLLSEVSIYAKVLCCYGVYQQDQSRQYQTGTPLSQAIVKIYMSSLSLEPCRELRQE